MINLKYPMVFYRRSPAIFYLTHEIDLTPGTGWLSFYKAVEGNIEGNRHGMVRTEVLAKRVGI